MLILILFSFIGVALFSFFFIVNFVLQLLPFYSSIEHILLPVASVFKGFIISFPYAGIVYDSFLFIIVFEGFLFIVNTIAGSRSPSKQN